MISLSIVPSLPARGVYSLSLPRKLRTKNLKRNTTPTLKLYIYPLPSSPVDLFTHERFPMQEKWCWRLALEWTWATASSLLRREPFSASFGRITGIFILQRPFIYRSHMLLLSRLFPTKQAYKALNYHWSSSTHYWTDSVFPAIYVLLCGYDFEPPKRWITYLPYFRWCHPPYVSGCSTYLHSYFSTKEGTYETDKSKRGAFVPFIITIAYHASVSMFS